MDDENKITVTIDLNNADSKLLDCLGNAIKKNGVADTDRISSLKLFLKNYSFNPAWGKDAIDLLWDTPYEKKYELILEISTKLKDRGDVDAYGYLGKMYGYGIGVKKDLCLGKKLLGYAAESREWCRILLYNLLWKHRFDGCGQEYFDTALYFYKRGDAEASFRLSRSYKDGIGVDRNLKKAVELLREASNMGHVPAMNELFDILWGMGTQSSFEEAFRLAKKSYDLGDPYGAYHLARAYSQGHGTYMDCEIAKDLFKFACSAGIVQAQWRYFDLLLELDDPRDDCDFNKLVALFEKKQDAESQIRVSWAYNSGRVRGDPNILRMTSLDIQLRVSKTMSPRRNNMYFSNLLPELYGYELKKWYDAVKCGDGVELNLENPVTFDEKIQWLKINDCSDLKTMATDKYACREFVSKKIGAQYLIPLIGVYESWDEINFEELPSRFVLKTNHGSGYNHIVLNKGETDLRKVGDKFTRWLRTDYSGNSLELQYKHIPRKIVVEQYIEAIGSTGSLVDYKIHCFNGVPKFIQCIWNRDTKNHSANNIWYDTKWNVVEFTDGIFVRPELGIEKPSRLEEMLNISRILSEDFSYVRVDLYCESDLVLFGELTFTPYGGVHKYNELFTPAVDKMLGDMIML